MFDPSPLLLMAAVVLDAIFKDPHYRFHPVRLVGDLVALGEELCRRLPFSQRAQGLVLVIGVETATVLSVLLLDLAFAPLHLSWLVVLFLGYSALAGGSLWEEIERVGEAVARGDLELARAQLSLLVTRDTSNMSASEVLRASTESLAENTLDGIVSPLLFFALGGAPLAFFFKAADTLDSMVGYQTPRYAQFGWAAARLDDSLNYIPARLTAVLVACAGVVMGRSFGETMKTVKLFSRNSQSPNSGYPEAAFAGALGVRLGGGKCVYFGDEVELPPIGDGREVITTRDLFMAVNLSKITTFCALVVAIVVAII